MHLDVDAAQQPLNVDERRRAGLKRRWSFGSVVGSFAIAAVILVGAAIGSSRSSAPAERPDLVAPVAGDFVTAEPASEAARRDGTKMWYPIAEERLEGKQWGIYAVGPYPCLRREVRGDAGEDIACWQGWFDANIGLQPAISSAEGTASTVYTFVGFTPTGVARVRIAPAAGQPVDVPTFAVPGEPVLVYGALLTGDIWSRPVSYELLDGDGLSLSGRRCEEDQYTLRLRQEAKGTEGRTVATPLLSVEGLRGVRPCLLSLDVSLLIEGEDGRGVGVRGNGTSAQTRGIVTSSTGPLMWEWTNWCGPRDGLRYVARLEGRIVASVRVVLPPDCVEASEPSTLRGSRTEQPRQR